MPEEALAKMLSGGDRRSIGRSNEVVSAILRRPEEFEELVECLWSSDAVVRMRAADAIEKISLRRVDLLEGYKGKLLELMEETEQQELRWHLAQIIPRLALTKADAKRAGCSVQRLPQG